MKKFYTVLAAAAVAISAVAAPTFATDAAKSIKKCPKTIQSFQSVKPSTRLAAPVTAASVSSVEDILGIYEVSANSYSADGQYTSYATLSAVEGKENTVKFNGLLYQDVVFEGVVDCAAGTITCEGGQYILDAYDQSYNTVRIYLFSAESVADASAGNIDETSPIVFTIAADGSISYDKTIVLGAQGGAGAVDYLDQIVYEPSDANTTIEFGEYSVDDEGYFTEEVVEYTTYANSVLSGSTVTVSGFVYGDCEDIDIDFDLATGKAVLGPQYAFTITVQGTNYDIYVGALGTSSMTAIEGTVAGNVISWTGDWAFMCDAGIVSMHKGAKLTFSFNLDGSGVSDIAVDNENAPVEYFNLQGVRVENPSNGLYIRRQGNVATKVLVK